MKLKNIISDYKNKSNENSKNKKAELNIKSILQEYKNKKNENSDYLFEALAKHIKIALNDIKNEFDLYGEDRKASIEEKNMQFSLIVYVEGVQEYIYRLTIKDNKPPFLSVIVYEIKDKNIEIGSEQKINILEDKKFFNEKNIKNDFYVKYKAFLMSKV